MVAYAADKHKFVLMNIHLNCFGESRVGHNDGLLELNEKSEEMLQIDFGILMAIYGLNKYVVKSFLIQL